MIVKDSGIPMEKNITEEMLDNLRKLPFLFHLSGSRRWDTHSKDSDWDFFVQDDFSLSHNSLYFSLRDLGFRAESEKDDYNISTRVWDYGEDLFATVVMQHKAANIHIQLVKDVKLKSRVQEKFKKIGKLTPTQIDWNLAFQLMGE